MNWMAVLPEIVLLTMACVVTLADLWVSDPRRSPTYWLTQLSLAVVGALHLWAFDAGDTVYAMQDMVVADPIRSRFPVTIRPDTSSRSSTEASKACPCRP